jgi:hypothetical protein
MGACVFKLWEKKEKISHLEDVLVWRSGEKLVGGAVLLAPFKPEPW